MTPPNDPDLPGARGAVPLRGTQSLVGVMAFVWNQPALTAIELLWRWLAAVPLLFLAWHALAAPLRAIPLNTAALESMTFLEPVRSAAVLARQLVPFRRPVLTVARWWLPLAVLLWTAAATLGRTVLLRRSDPSLRPQWLRMAVASGIRAGLFLLVLFLWLRCQIAAVGFTVTGPARRGEEPNLVLLAALAVLVTLMCFFAWAVSIWSLDVWPVKAMGGFALDGTHGRELRSKLRETDLVMGIVRVILLVVGLAFSASPLPFQTRQTQAFIDVWWVSVAVLYILSSDFFHVVRRVTYLRLLQSIASRANAGPPRAS